MPAVHIAVFSVRMFTRVTTKMIAVIIFIVSLHLSLATAQLCSSSCANYTSVSDDGTFAEFNNCTVRRTDDGMMFPLIGYTRNGEMIICWNQTMTGMCVDNADSSYVLPDNAVAIVYGTLLPFAVVTFLTYAIFKSLRTLPGVILMNLEMAYILSHIITIIFRSIQLTDGLQEVTCTLSNIGIFYATAAIGTWKNIFLQQTCWIFYKASKLQSATPNSITKTVLIYCIIGWGLPLVVSMVIFAVDFTDRRDFVYETDRCIRILDEAADGVGKALAFIYIGLQNLYNVVLFFIIIGFFFQALYESDKEISKQRSIKTQLLKVSFAVLVITGASWIFTLIAAYQNALWITGIALSLRAVEQLIIFILFTLTKTVLKLYIDMTKNIIQRLKQFFT